MNTLWRYRWLVAAFAAAMLVISPVSYSQDDFSDELEAELEEEIGLSEDAEGGSGDDFSEEDFGDDESSSESSEEVAEEDSSGDEDFGDEDFGEDDFDDAEFSDKDFDEGFEDFEDTEDGSQVAEEPTVPIEENLGDDVKEDDFDLEPLSEEPDAPIAEEPMEMPEPSAEPDAPIEDTVGPPVEDFQTVSNTPTAPNLEYESRLYDIYVNYHANPTPSGQWEMMLGSRKAEVYSIFQGDTLWGISETFFGDGNYWPKIWSINTSIENPHLIEPGNQIQFVMGTEAEAPMFTVTEGEATGESPEVSQAEVEQLVESGALSAQDTQQLQEILDEGEGGATEEMPPEMEETQEVLADAMEDEGSDEPDIEIPPPGVISRPVLKKLPPSVPEWQSANAKGDYDDLGIDYGIRKITQLKDETFLLSYIDDVPDSSDAVVVEIEKGAFMASDLEYVYVRFPKGKGRMGDKYIVVQSQGKIKRSALPVETNDLGYQKKISGAITIGYKVRADVSDRFEVYRAMVNKSVNPIIPGAQLVKGELPMVNLSESGPRSQLVAQIIGGTDGKRRSVFGKSSIVYLSRGLVDGIKQGQVLDIRAHRMGRNSDTQILTNNLVIGQLKIVKAVKRFSTAVIVNSTEPVLAGDLTGVGQYADRGRGTVAASAIMDDEEEFATDDVSDDELDSLLDDTEDGFEGEDGSDEDLDF